MEEWGKEREQEQEQEQEHEQEQEEAMPDTYSSRFSMSESRFSMSESGRNDCCNIQS